MLLPNPYATKKTPSMAISRGSNASSNAAAPKHSHVSGDSPPSLSNAVTPSSSAKTPFPNPSSVSMNTEKPVINAPLSSKGKAFPKPLPMASKALGGSSSLNLRKEVQALKAAQKVKLQQLQRQKEERKLLKQQQKILAKENQTGNAMPSLLPTVASVAVRPQDATPEQKAFSIVASVLEKERMDPVNPSSSKPILIAAPPVALSERDAIEPQNPTTNGALPVVRNTAVPLVPPFMHPPHFMWPPHSWNHGYTGGPPPFFYPPHPMMATPVDPTGSVPANPVPTPISHPWVLPPSHPFPLPQPPPAVSIVKVPPPPKKQKVPALLSKNPMQEPSPYCKTHEVIEQEFVLVKPNVAGASFGVTVKLEMAHVLVDPEFLAAGSTAASLQTEDTPMDAMGVPPPRRRRRRVCYTVLWVRDPSIHNQRWSTLLVEDAPPPQHLLQPGDILLSIAGTSVEGLSLAQACTLFQECTSSSVNDTVVRCSLSIARYLPDMQKKLLGEKLPRPVVASLAPTVPMNLLNKTKLSAQEILAFVNVLFRTMNAEHRLLGAPSVKDDVLVSTLSREAIFVATRGVESGSLVLSKWTELCKKVKTAMSRAASDHWWQQLVKELPEIRRTPRIWSDAQLSAARQRHPGSTRRNCRCGSDDHLYVNDILCPLYSNVRRWVDDPTKNSSSNTSPNWTAPSTEDDIAKKSRVLSKNISRELNVVEKAYCDRFVRSRTEQQNEEAETQFIERMEEIQIHKMGQAHRAPSLTAMVLSAIADLESEFADQLLQLPDFLQSPVSYDSDGYKEDVSDDEDDVSDDEDDVPLAALSKRHLNHSPRQTKKLRMEKNTSNSSVAIHPMFLAKLVQFLSYRWGHVFQEPSNDEYAW